MDRGDNAPPPADWAPIAKCCGLLHDTVECSVCGEYVKPLTMPDAVLGEN